MKKYLSIYESLKKEITEGVYKTGSKLPSKRTLADQWGVSIITVEHAYELLLDEGYIDSVEKSGYFVVYEAGDTFYGNQNTVSKETEIYDDSSSGLKLYNDSFKDESYYFSFDVYAKTVRHVLSNMPDEIMQKSPTFGIIKLRNSISEYLLRSRHIHVSPKQIMIGAGAEYLYAMIVRTLGTDVIYGIETPGYSRIKEVYESDGVTTETLKLGNDGIESSELRKSKAGILHITPYRSFPTGVSASAGKKKEYLQWANERGGIIIEDDFESEFTPSRKAVDTIFSMDKNGCVIYVNTFTRTISPSLRMAYMLLPLNLLEKFEEKTSFYSCPVPTLEQLAVSNLLDSGEFERHINRVRRNLRKR
ncbi:MAG: PLP-dependent aminotransferase family protein [Lachnospiraceae bacterium]|nr:PLP-dependent aminotransferase family protein [Lachnospiraceae bacterium]